MSRTWFIADVGVVDFQGLGHSLVAFLDGTVGITLQPGITVIITHVTADDYSYEICSHYAYYSGV